MRASTRRTAPPESPDPDLLPPIRPPWNRRRVLLTLTAVVAIVAAVFSFRLTGISIPRFIDGLDSLQNLFGRMVPPRFTDPWRAIVLVLETLMIALAGTGLAVIISVPVAYLAARNTSPGRVTSQIARGFIVSTRAIPDLVFALIFVRAIGIGALPGVLAVGIHSVGMVGKLFAASIEEIDPGPLEAVRTTGAGRVQSFVTGVLPQVIPNWISTMLYRLDINVRSSVVLGFVGAGGIGFELQARLRSLRYRSSLALIILIFVLIVIVERVSTASRQAILSTEESQSKSKNGERGLWGALRERARRRTDASDLRLSPPWTSARIARISWAFFGLLAVLWSFWYVGLTPQEIVKAVPDIGALAADFFPPDFVTYWADLWPALLETVAIGLAATVIGVPVAIPIAFLAARNVAPARWVYNVARYFIVAGRGVPSLVIALLFVSAVGLGPFAGTMALAIGSTFFIAKLFADAIEEVKEGPRNAIRSTGATRLQESVASVIPQVIPSLIGNTLYMFDINIRISTILGLVGGGGIGVLLQGSLRTYNYQLTGAIILAIFIIVIVLEQISSWIRSQFL